MAKQRAQEDFSFRLHELMKPLAEPHTTVVHNGRTVARGSLGFDVQESDGDHLFRVGRVSFVESDVERLDDETQTITLRAEWQRRTGRSR